MPQDAVGWIIVIAALALGFALGRMSGRGAERRDALMGLPGQAMARAVQAEPPAANPRATPPSTEAIRAALAAGNKIEAIKLVREATGLGLKEAKDAVEAMERGS